MANDDVLEPLRETRSEHFACQASNLCQIFKLIVSKSEKIVGRFNVVLLRHVRKKRANLHLPFVAQKPWVACLKSLLGSLSHVFIAKYLFSLGDDDFKNLGDTAVLACEMFTSGCCPRLSKTLPSRLVHCHLKQFEVRLGCHIFLEHAVLWPLAL